MHGRTIARTAAFIAAAAITAPAAAWAVDENAKGDERSETAPGQVKPAGEPAQPQQSQRQANGHAKQQTAGDQRSEKARSAPNGQAKGHSKPAAPRGQAKGKSNGKPAPKTNGNAGGMAHQKTTICHATGSATNPFVTITISNAALDAHRAHQDGRDIIPAPAGGCPGGTENGGNGDNGDNGKTTICHATGSATNPFVIITISNSALPAHESHQDGRDIIPAPAEGCPGDNGGNGPTPPLNGGNGTLPPGNGDVLTNGPQAPEGGVLGEFEESPDGGAAPGAEADEGGVAGEETTREAGADTAAAKLPFTGLDLWVVLVAGLALMLGGVAMKRVAANRS